MRSRLLVLGFVVGLALPATAVATTQPAAAACAAATPRPILENRYGRVLVTRETLVVCPRAGRPFVFADEYRPRASSSPAGGPTLVALNNESAIPRSRQVNCVSPRTAVPAPELTVDDIFG